MPLQGTLAAARYQMSERVGEMSIGETLAIVYVFANVHSRKFDLGITIAMVTNSKFLMQLIALD